MRRILALSALSLVLAGGAAFANPRGGAPSPVTRDHRGGISFGGHGAMTGGSARDRHNSAWSGGPNIGDHRATGWDTHATVGLPRPIVRGRYHDVHRESVPIYESYSVRPGYIWVAGRWQWNGYEWIWQPGHYEIDAAYPGGNVPALPGY